MADVVPTTPPKEGMSPLMTALIAVLSAIAAALAGNRFGPTPDPKPTPDNVVPDKKEEQKVVPPAPKPEPDVVPNQSPSIELRIKYAAGKESIYILQPKSVPPEDPTVELKSKVDTVASDLKNLTGVTEQLKSSLLSLAKETLLVEGRETAAEARITALEGSRPPPKPIPDPNPVVTPKTLHLVVIEPLNAAGTAVNRTGEMATFLNRLESWKSKHSYRVLPINSPESEGKKAVTSLSGIPLPAIAVYDQANSQYLGYILAPTSFDQFLALIKNFGG